MTWRVAVIDDGVHAPVSTFTPLLFRINQSLDMAFKERSEEVWLWYTTVYEAIQEIPHGKVTSYGHIARLVGRRKPLSVLCMTRSRC